MGCCQTRKKTTNLVRFLRLRLRHQFLCYRRRSRSRRSRTRSRSRSRRRPNQAVPQPNRRNRPMYHKTRSSRHNRRHNRRRKSNPSRYNRRYHKHQHYRNHSAHSNLNLAQIRVFREKSPFTHFSRISFLQSKYNVHAQHPLRVYPYRMSKYSLHI